VNPLTVNPNNVEFIVTGWINSTNFSRSFHNLHCSNGYQYSYTLNFTAAYANETVVINNGTGGTFHPVGWMPTTFASGLAPKTSGWWSVTVVPVYRVTNQTFCGGVPSGPPTRSWSTGSSIAVSGWYTTNLETLPTTPVIHIAGSAVGGKQRNYIAWNNSMQAQAATGIAGGASYHNSTSNFSFNIGERTPAFWVPVNKSYTAWINLTSANGTTNKSWPNQLYTGLNLGVVSHPLSNTSSCSFTESSNPIQVYWNATRSNFSSNITTSSITLTWYSNSRGNGWASYNDSSDGRYTQSATLVDLTQSPNHPFRDASGRIWNFSYVTQLHGLASWGLYFVYMGVSTFTGCLEFDQSSGAYVQVQSLVQLQEMDLPYDSITHEGGGAVLTWSVPSQFGAAAHLVNGTLTYFPWNSTSHSWNTSATVQIPLPSLSSLIGGSQFVSRRVNSTFQVNLTALSLNTTYNATVVLNYTIGVGGQPFQAGSQPFVWVYGKDSSGGGLTDWEKIRGWGVTTQSATGAWNTRWATASPYLPATNGLVGDFLEKEYGLNPGSIDTAGSNMLDTWNLTFDLGSNASNPATPSQFHAWSELGHFNFSRFCAYPGQPTSACTSQLTHTKLTEPGNLSDNSPWAARVLWSPAALSTLESLMSWWDLEPWLRGVLGTTVITVSGAKTTERTLTVEGKLSWGANPLATSTPLNGVPDGYVINPLGTMDLQLKVLNWTATGLSPNDGAAAYEHAWSPAAPFYWATTDYSGYTQQQLAGSQGNSRYTGTLTVTFPVTSTEQFANLNLTLVTNSGGYHRPIDTGNLSVDLLNSSWKLGYWVNGTNYLGYEYQVLTVYSKAPTFVYVPAGNSSLSVLPLGLQRYSGEQNFVLLVINDTINGSNSMSQGNLPYPYANGSVSSVTYAVALSGGLNNILVSRSAFIKSPLGQALLNGTNVSIPYTPANQYIQPSWDSQRWYARVTGNSSYHGSDYSAGKTGYVRVFSNTSQNCTVNPSLCGGVPANPSLEKDHSALALQAILTLNATNLNQLDDILAGLLLNRSGNFTGWLFGATAYAPSLGLSQGVLRALANASFESGGAFGPPKSGQHHPSSWASLAGSTVWNAVSGVVGAVSVVWNAAVAGIAYVSKLVQMVAGWALGALNQVSGILKTVAGAMLWAIEQLAAVIRIAISNLLSPVVVSIKNAFESDFANILAGYNLANSTHNGANPVADSRYLVGAAPLFLLAASLSALVIVGATMATPVEPVVGPLGAFLPIVLVAAFGSGASFVPIGKPGLNVLNPQTAFNSSGTLAFGFLDPGCVGTSAALQAALTSWIFGVLAVFVAPVALILASLNGPAAMIIPGLALTFAIIAMVLLLLAAYPLPNTPTQQITNELSAGTIFAFLSVGTDVLSLLGSFANRGFNTIVAAVGLGIDAVGFYFGLTIKNNPCR
jgi:hypothetical protein